MRPRRGNLGIGNAPLPWRLGERRTAGPRSSSSGAPCHCSPVEQAQKPKGRFSLATGGLLPKSRGLRFGAPSASLAKEGSQNAPQKQLRRGWSNYPLYLRAVPRINFALIFDHLDRDYDGSISRAHWPAEQRVWDRIIYGSATVPAVPLSLEDLELSRTLAHSFQALPQEV